MNLKTSGNNSDARQNLKITFQNIDYQSSPNTYAETTSQGSKQKNMGQTNNRTTNQQSTEQKRSSLQRNQEENNPATILVPDTQERDDTTSKDQHFLFQSPNQNN